MTSIKHRISGYLKQIAGEVVGSQPLHETGKREVLGLTEETFAERSDPSALDPAAQAGKPHHSAPGGSKSKPEAGSTVSFPDHGHQAETRRSVYTQMLATIEQEHGAFVKVALEDDVVYVAIPCGGTIHDATDIILKMAERLSAEPERAQLDQDAETADGWRSKAHVEESNDLEDQLEIGLLDSFPASDPPAAAATTVLPKKHDHQAGTENQAADDAPRAPERST